MKYTAKDGQSIFDLVLLLDGNLDNTYNFITTNNISSINSNTQAGVEYEYTEIKTNLSDYIKLNNIVYNTSDPKIITGKAFSNGFFGKSFF